MNLNVSRRALIIGSLSVTFIDRVFALPYGIGQRDVLPMLPGMPILELSDREKGIKPALDLERRTADLVLNKAPKAVNPFKVAQYFLRVGQGLENPPNDNTWPNYIREWPERYNPVIVNFFGATDTNGKVQGDCTAWCAAFVNWCIQRGREGRPEVPKLDYTHSAASKSFRTWGTETKNPAPGDIVVFESTKDSNMGHVGFYSGPGQDSGTVRVLGGNQGGKDNETNPDTTTCKDHNAAGGRVSEALHPIKGKTLRLHSFRTDTSLHDLG